MKTKTPVGFITVSIRKRSTGSLVTRFTGDDMNHLHFIARMIVTSDAYNQCYVVGTDQSGNEIFTAHAPGAGPAAPPAHYPPPQSPYPQAPVHVPPQPLPPYQAEYRQVPTTAPRVLDAEFVEAEPPPTGLNFRKLLPWGSK